MKVMVTKCKIVSTYMSEKRFSVSLSRNLQGALGEAVDAPGRKRRR
jgi:hypothetical protein